MNENKYGRVPEDDVIDKLFRAGVAALFKETRIAIADLGRNLNADPLAALTIVQEEHAASAMIFEKNHAAAVAATSRR